MNGVDSRDNVTKKVYLQRLEDDQDFRVVKHNPLPQAICLGLDQDVPFNIPERSITLAVLAICQQQPMTLLDSNPIVADDLNQRREFKAWRDSVVDSSPSLVDGPVKNADQTVKAIR